MRVAHVLVIALAPAAAACTLLPWSSLTAGGPDASSDGSSEGSSSDADGAIDGSDGGIPGNVLPDPGFETTTVGCGVWGAFNASVTITNDAHTGTHACLICASGPGNGATYAEPKVNGKKGQLAQWSGWFKNPATGSAAAVPGSELDFIDNVGDGGTQTTFGTELFGTSTWAPFSLTSDPANGPFDAVGLNMVVHSPDGGQACVVVDDMSLVVGN